MGLEDVQNELGLTEFESRRAIAQGKLKASITNPERIDGPKGVKPVYRIRRADFEAFVGKMAGVRVGADFLSDRGWFSGIWHGSKVHNAAKAYLRSISDETWLQTARIEVRKRGHRRTGLFGSFETILNSEVRDVFNEKVPGKSVDSEETTVARATVNNHAIRQMRSEVEDRYGRNISLRQSKIDRVFWTRKRYLSLIAAVQDRVIKDSIVVRGFRVQLHAEEGNYDFGVTAFVPMTALASVAEINRITAQAF